MEGIGSTIISFPDRGPWGDNKYRGNCSGYVHKGLIEQYKVRSMGEVFAGSGTGSDVCREMGIPYCGLDLNHNPVRDDIIGGFNAITDEIPEEFYGKDMVFMHPPYGKEIGIPYAGKQWNKKGFMEQKGYDPAKADLGQMPWPVFMKTLNFVVMKFYAAMDKGSRMAVLMGDVKRKGRLYSMLCDIIKPGQLEQVIIKAQHNCWAGSRSYSSRNYVPIEHEYIMVLKKAADIIDFSLPQRHEFDIRDSKDATWRDVVCAVMGHLGGKASLEEIYGEVEGYKRCERVKDWKAKVRQTLQRSCVPVERGVWAMAA